jgi:succinoglycan biosynthesis protein ExoM
VPVSSSDHISVCICTYQRPELLARLLAGLEQQATDGCYTFDVVVVDNDPARSAQRLVTSGRFRLDLAYDWEPERNISLARNRAVRNARGNLIAFIDDDERPGPEWLAQLYRTLREQSADGVLGPVVPELPPNSPEWLTRARVFERKRHRTKTPIGASDARTGNALLVRSLFVDHEEWFDPAFGRTGGEDSDFFARQFRKGRRFVWCDEAVAHEAVPPDRWSVSYHLRRLWRAGTLDGEWIRDGRIPGKIVVAKNVVVLAASAAALAVSVLLPKHVRVRVAQKCAYCGGLVSAYLGWSMMRDRD